MDNKILKQRTDAPLPVPARRHSIVLLGNHSRWAAIIHPDWRPLAQRLLTESLGMRWQQMETTKFHKFSIPYHTYVTYLFINNSISSANGRISMDFIAFGLSKKSKKKQDRNHEPEWTNATYVNMHRDMHSVATPFFVIWVLFFFPLCWKGNYSLLPQYLPQSFRDHSASFRETHFTYIPSASFRDQSFLAFASATTAPSCFWRFLVVVCFLF